MTALRVVTAKDEMRAPALGLVPSTLRPTWSEACEEFYDEKHLESLSPLTVRQYRHVLEPFGRYMAGALGHQRPEEMTEADVRAFLQNARERGISGKRPGGARRLNHIRDHLRRFYDWLEDRGYVSHNPGIGTLDAEF